MASKSHSKFLTFYVCGPNTKRGAAATRSIVSHVEDPNIAVEKGSIRKRVDIDAGVLFHGPCKGQPQNDERRKLERVCGKVPQPVFTPQGLESSIQPNTEGSYIPFYLRVLLTYDSQCQLSKA